MGALSDLDVDDTPASITGNGVALVRWWQAADADDRATFHSWVAAGTSGRVLAERITAAGFPIAQGTVMYGLHLLRRLPEWAS